MKILFVYHASERKGSAYAWRGLGFAEAIQRTGMHTASSLSFEAFRATPPQESSVGMDYDVVVLDGCHDPETGAMIQRYKALGTTVIIDVESAGLTWQDGSGQVAGIDAPSGWQELPGEAQDRRALYEGWFLRLADGITTTSPWMARRLDLFSRVFVVPTLLDLARYANNARREHTGLIIGWRCGSHGRDELVETGALEGVLRVLNVYPQVHLAIWAGENHPGLRLPVPSRYKKRFCWLSTSWPEALSICDVAIVPSQHPGGEADVYHALLEYMVMRIPWIASRQVYLADLQPYGWMIQNTANGWECALRDILDNYEAFRLDAGSEPYLYGISQGLDENIDQILSTYRMIREQAVLSASMG